MNEPDQPSAGGESSPEVRLTRAQRRRQKMAVEIQRNRQGGHTVPTWAMALLLTVLVGGWLFLVLTA